MLRRCLSIVLLVALGVTAGRAWAAWPKPALGPSRSGDPEVAFSFDDGPDAQNTPKILKLLAQHHVQAIFFMVGQRIETFRPGAQARRAVVEQVVEANQLVGSHTVNHVHLCHLPPDEGGLEIDAAMRGLEELTDLPMVLFRTPYGDHCDRVLALLEERGLSHVHWDIDPQEWTDHDAERAARDVITHLQREGNGRVMVLMHDTKSATIEALRLVLEWIEHENQKRARRGQHPIHIVDASDWVAETLDPDVTTFAGDLAWHTLDRLERARNALVPRYPPRMVSR